jgi:hypothetical protein
MHAAALPCRLRDGESPEFGGEEWQGMYGYSSRASSPRQRPGSVRTSSAPPIRRSGNLTRPGIQQQLLLSCLSLRHCAHFVPLP